jgi:CzcA family heavy metal efflux pump
VIEQLIRWSLRNRLVVVLAAALLALAGGWQAARTPIDVFPDLTAPSVSVIAEAPGMSPLEVETQVALPIESAMIGAAEVRRVRTAAKTALAVVTVEFDWGTPIAQARQSVAERLQLARAALPGELPPPVMAPSASIMGEILFIALTAESRDGVALRQAADQIVRRRLLAIPGVAEIVPIGGDARQFQVTVRPERLAAYGLTLDQVIRAAGEANRNAPAGFVTAGGQEYLIQGQGRARDAQDIGKSVVAVREGVPVLLEQVASVGAGTAVPRGAASANGRPAVVLGIQKQPGANTLELTRRLDAALDEIEAALPAGMRIERHIFRQADFIEAAIRNLMEHLLAGAALVVAVVFGFLLSVRAGLVTLLAIPLSLLATVLAMKLAGATINTMTLGGMAIALGALVDDAIIVVENIVRRLRENRQRAADRRLPVAQVVFAASREIQGSIVFATLIIVLVFLPLFFLSGVEGRLMAPLGFAYVVALAASLLVALTVTPVLSQWLLPECSAVRRAREPRLARALHAGYGRLIEAVLARWRPIAAAAALLLAAALAGLFQAGRAFLPEFNEGTLTVSASTVPGTALEESDRLGRLVEQILLSQPEVVTTARRTGRSPLDPHALDVHESEIEVSLKMRERSKDALLAALRAELAQVPGMNVVVGQPISHRIDHMLSGSRANIAVKIFGPDLTELRRLAQAVKAVAEAVPGTADVVAEQQSDVPLLAVAYRREALARHGLTAREISEAIETAFAGLAVSRIQVGQASHELVVRYDPAARASIEAVRATLVTTPTGARVPLAALADIRNDRGPFFVNRENAQRKTVVMANTAGRDLGSVVEDLRRAVSAQVALPRGYHIEYGGQFESAAQAQQALLLTGALVIGGVFVLLFVAFGSARDATLVMLNLPLALIGGVAGVHLAGGTLSVASIIGFITLFGIATRNGVMLVAHIHHLVDIEGVRDARVAVRRGAEERLLPILMTALAAGLALVPIALAAGEPGTEIQAPMAVVILCGLATSTLLNMIVVPAMYLRFGARARELRREADTRPGVAHRRSLPASAE